MKVTIDGIKVPWRGGARLVPFLTPADSERFGPQVEKTQDEWRAGTIGERDLRDRTLVIIAEVMRRNYPEVTIADLKRNLTLSCLVELWPTLWDASRLYHAPAGFNA